MQKQTPFSLFIRQALLYPLVSPFLPQPSDVKKDVSYASGQKVGTYEAGPTPPATNFVVACAKSTPDDVSGEYIFDGTTGEYDSLSYKRRDSAYFIFFADEEENWKISATKGDASGSLFTQYSSVGAPVAGNYIGDNDNNGFNSFCSAVS